MPGSSPGRFSGFLIISGVLITATAISAGWLVGAFFEHHVRAHEQEQLAEIVQSQAVHHLSAGVFQYAEDPASVLTFQTFLEGLPGVFRIKAFDARGTIVWSNEPRLIGRTFRDNPDLARALGGKTTKAITPPTKSEHVHEGGTPYFGEVYVPITFSGHVPIAGVIEAYKDMTAVMTGVHRTQLHIWMVTGAMGVFLYAGLALIVRRALLNELRAIQRLEAQNQDLVEMDQHLEETNRALQEAQAELVEKERLAAVGEVVVSLHHAILNPLTGVLGALLALGSENTSACEKVRALSDAEGEIRKIERLIRKLPDLQQAKGVPYVGTTKMLDLAGALGGESYREV